MPAGRIVLAALLVGVGCADDAPVGVEAWDARLRGHKLVHVWGDDASRRHLLWLCADGTAVARWDTDADDERGPRSGDEVARWTLGEEEGSVCVGIVLDEDGLEIEAPCVPIEPEGDGFRLEERLWTIAGDAGC